MEHFWEHVRSSDYYRNVLRNMIGPKAERRVRFGTTGVGVSPHYEIIADGAKPMPYSGLNHEPAPEEKFDDGNLSREYSYGEVQLMLSRCGKEQ